VCSQLLNPESVSICINLDLHVVESNHVYANEASESPYVYANEASESPYVYANEAIVSPYVYANEASNPELNVNVIIM